MNTIKEVSDIINKHQSVIDALNAAIGTKASAAEFDSHVKDAVKHITSSERTTWNSKLSTTGDASNLTNIFTQATTRTNLVSNEKLSVSLGKIMKWFADLTDGASSTTLGTNLTANKALISNSSGKVEVSSISSTELGYLSGVKSKIQTQINIINAKFITLSWMSKITVTTTTTSGALAIFITNCDLYILSTSSSRIQVHKVWCDGGSTMSISSSGYSATFTAGGSIGSTRVSSLIVLRGKFEMSGTP